jgi:hypothetical protein
MDCLNSCRKGEIKGQMLRPGSGSKIKQYILNMQ